MVLSEAMVPLPRGSWRGELRLGVEAEGWAGRIGELRTVRKPSSSSAHANGSMGKKKTRSFIDKKNSTTYTLTWGGGGQEDDGDDAASQAGSAARGYSEYGPQSAYGGASEWG
jgi:hypothetical protein